MMMTKRFSLAALLLFWMVAALAGPAETDLPIGTKDGTLEGIAFAEAMRHYLTQASGDPAFWQDERAASLISNASRYVRRFSYPHRPGGKGLILRVQFDATAIQQDLAAHGLSLGAGVGVSDSLVIWLVQGMGEAAQLLGREDAMGAYAAASRYANGAGMGLVIPLTDLGEQATFRSALSAEEQDQRLLELSQRYGQGSVLIGRLGPIMGGDLTVDWRLFGAGEPRGWNDRAADVDFLMAAVMNRLGQQAPAARTPPKTIQSIPLRLRVKGRVGASDAELQHYLSGLSLIQSVKSLPGQDGDALFELQTLGKRTEVAALIPLGGQLRAVAQPGQPVKKTRRPQSQDFGFLSDLQPSSRQPEAKPQADILVFERIP